MMGYIEDRAAEGQRQAFEAAKRAEAAKVMNQGSPTGLARLRAEAYAEGISPEDAYRISQIKAVQDTNAINNMINKNRAYNETLRNAEAGLRNGGSIDANQMNAIREYKNTIDPGLAAKWMADRESFR